MTNLVVYTRLLPLAFIALASGRADAATIIGYNVNQARGSGYGGWGHFYSGTITPTGATNAYTGGTGTMADGTVGTGIATSQLFVVADSPTITILLNESSLVNAISLFNFIDSNNIPGNITGVDVTIGGITQTFATSVLGTRDEFINLSATSLSLIGTNSITLSNFTTQGTFSEYYAISEMVVAATSVPEPSPAVLLGLAALGFAVRRRRC